MSRTQRRKSYSWRDMPNGRIEHPSTYYQGLPIGDSDKTRVRRGREVTIPQAWVGKITHKKTKRARHGAGATGRDREEKRRLREKEDNIKHPYDYE